MSGFQIVSELVRRQSNIQWVKSKYGQISAVINIFNFKKINVMLSSKNGSWNNEKPVVFKHWWLSLEKIIRNAL